MNEQLLSDVFHALSDPTRRGIVGLLRAGPRTAGELAEAFPLARSTLSAHFTVLRYAGLIGAERQGRSIVYHLNPAAIEPVVSALNGLLPATVRAPHPRHPEPARTRRRDTVPALALQGALGLILARLAGAPLGTPLGTPSRPGQPAPLAPLAPAPPGAAPPFSSPGALPQRGTRRRGLAHILRRDG